MPDTIQFKNGDQIVHVYDAEGNRRQTTYYTRRVKTVVPAFATLPASDNPQEYSVVSYANDGNKRYVRYGSGAWQLDYVFNPEGYTRYYGAVEHYPFYYIKDHLGTIRETYVIPEPGYRECVQRMQYYPSGLPWNNDYGASEQPFKYNGKEFVEMHGLDEYDSEARWYYPAIMRTTTMDPLCEKYYSTSPYAWCGNNPINLIDPDGRVVDKKDSTTISEYEQTTAEALRYSEKWIAHYTNRLKRDGLSDRRQEFLNQRLIYWEGMHGLYDIALSAIEFIKKDPDHIYSLSQPFGNCHVRIGEHDKILIEGSSMATYIHEMVHILFSYRVDGNFTWCPDGTLSYAENPLSWYGQEVVCYKVQGAINKSSLPFFVNNVMNITSSHISNICQDGIYPYRFIDSMISKYIKSMFSKSMPF